MIRYLASDSNSRIYPFAKALFKYSCNTSTSFSDSWYIGPKVGCFPSWSLILWSPGWCFGNAWSSTTSWNRCSYSLYCSGISGVALFSFPLAWWSVGLVLVSAEFSFLLWELPFEYARVSALLHCLAMLLLSTIVLCWCVGWLAVALLVPQHLKVNTFDFQSIRGLCSRSYGSPKMMSWVASPKTSRSNSSSCSWMLSVACLTLFVISFSCGIGSPLATCSRYGSCFCCTLSLA